MAQQIDLIITRNNLDQELQIEVYINLINPEVQILQADRLTYTLQEIKVVQLKVREVVQTGFIVAKLKEVQTPEVAVLL